MPGCCVQNCYGRSEKGVRLFLLPRGPKNQARREEWIKFINRKDLPNHAYVCENHFTPDQFENNRADLKRLLRWDAVPTVSTHGKKSKQKWLSARTKTEEDLLEESSTDEFNNTSDKSENTLDRLEIIIDTPQNTSKQCETNADEAKTLKRKLDKALIEVDRLKEENEVLKNQVRKLFNEDQIDVLKRGKRTGRQWQVDTIKKCMKIYLACGTRGYKELQKHHYPLPGIRTLQKQAKTLESRVLDDIFLIKEESLELEDIILKVEGAESEESLLSTEEMSDGATSPAREEVNSDFDDHPVGVNNVHR